MTAVQEMPSVFMATTQLVFERPSDEIKSPPIWARVHEVVAPAPTNQRAAMTRVRYAFWVNKLALAHAYPDGGSVELRHLIHYSDAPGADITIGSIRPIPERDEESLILAEWDS